MFLRGSVGPLGHLKKASFKRISKLVLGYNFRQGRIKFVNKPSESPNENNHYAKNLADSRSDLHLVSNVLKVG